MAKRRTWPTLFEECNRIELSYLWKRYAMWMPQHRKMSLAWTCCGRPAGNIDLIIDTREMYIELDYRFGDEPRHYRVQLVYVEPLPWLHFLQFRYSYQHRVNNSDRFVYNWNKELEEFAPDYDEDASNCFENQYSNHLFNLAVRTSRKKYNCLLYTSDAADD